MILTPVIVFMQKKNPLVSVMEHGQLMQEFKDTVNNFLLWHLRYTQKYGNAPGQYATIPWQSEPDMKKLIEVNGGVLDTHQKIYNEFNYLTCVVLNILYKGKKYEVKVQYSNGKVVGLDHNHLMSEEEKCAEVARKEAICIQKEQEEQHAKKLAATAKIESEKARAAHSAAARQTEKKNWEVWCHATLKNILRDITKLKVGHSKQYVESAGVQYSKIPWNDATQFDNLLKTCDGSFKLETYANKSNLKGYKVDFTMKSASRVYSVKCSRAMEFDDTFYVTIKCESDSQEDVMQSSQICSTCNKFIA